MRIRSVRFLALSAVSAIALLAACGPTNADEAPGCDGPETCSNHGTCDTCHGISGNVDPPAVATDFGTPIDLTRIIAIDKPTVRVRYELQEIGEANLEQLLAKFIG